MIPISIERKMRITKECLRAYIARYNKLKPPMLYTRSELFVKLMYAEPTEKKRWQALWRESLIEASHAPCSG